MSENDSKLRAAIDRAVDATPVPAVAPQHAAMMANAIESLKASLRVSLLQELKQSGLLKD